MRANRSEPVTSRGTPPVALLPDRACADVDTKVFFPTTGENGIKAKAICGICPHRQACLDWALATEQSWGIWGATSPEERAEMKREAS